MRCYRGEREKVLYSVTWEEDSQNISLKTEKNDERSFSRIPEYLRKIFWYRLTPVEFFSCLNLIGRGPKVFISYKISYTTHFVCLQLLRRVSFSKFLEKHLWAGKNVSLDYRPSIFLLHLHSKRYWNHVTSS